jgi:hypothetical protein
VHLIRAALVPGALLAACALVTACGETSSTADPGEPAATVSLRTSATPSETPTPTPTQTATAKPVTKSTTPKPTTTTKQIVEVRVIPFKKKTVTDDSLPKGEKEIRTTGVNGARKLTYKVTFVNGVQTAKELVRNEVSKRPRTQVTAVGTKVDEPASASSGCDPNYSGCVPIASDVDCSGGSGNGPEYVAGPIRVIGSDIYGLDRDGDGIACED